VALIYFDIGTDVESSDVFVRFLQASKLSYAPLRAGHLDVKQVTS